jgi:HAD superfamily hydrolase (TIGR01509 family)
MREDFVMMVADRLTMPENTRAVLWDMDGVLLDTLSLDLVVCESLVWKYLGVKAQLSREFIRSIFAYHPPEFWRRILVKVGSEHGIGEPERHSKKILEDYNDLRGHEVFKCNAGVLEILKDLSETGLKSAVVSNNPTAHVRQILETSGIAEYFAEIIGNDIQDLKKKPAPDTYRFAAERLGVSPENCVVVEDSLLGAEAGKRAGCFTVGVATGSADFEDLQRSGWTDRVYTSFARNHLRMAFGQVTQKHIVTPIDFVSHMIEHIAWRLGCEIELAWNHDDWMSLGRYLGVRIAQFVPLADQSCALGMIDDGSAETFIDRTRPPRLEMISVSTTDLQWFLSLRCEQLSTGEPLREMLEGLCRGLDAELRIRLCGVEDPHHSWEGIFRSVGIALSRIYTPRLSSPASFPMTPEETVCRGSVTVETRSAQYARVSRHTAESVVTVGVDFLGQRETACRINASSTVCLDPFCTLLSGMAVHAGFSIQIDFDAPVLSSSHAAIEDTGLTLGRALREVLVQRMLSLGATGSGDSFESPDDFSGQPVRVGVSVEGRKFWRLLPFEETHSDLKQRFIIGHTVLEKLYSEDLDDFLDGLSGGLGASIMIHLKDRMDPDQGWQMIFRHLGKALRGVFEINPYRRGVPPGVKATLE